MAQNAPKPEDGKVADAFKPAKAKDFSALETEFDVMIKKAGDDAEKEFLKVNVKPEEKKEAPPKPIATVNKVEVKKIFATIFKKKPEEVKDDEFNFFFKEIPQFEKDKEPVTIDALKTRLKSYANEIHFIATPTEAEAKKLKEAKDLFDAELKNAKKAIQEIKDPQKSLMDFYFLKSTEDNLSDITLVKNSTNYRQVKTLSN